LHWGKTSVNWLRTKAKKLSLLALFALALQLGLSFGHTHADVAMAGIAAPSQASAPDTDHDQDLHRDLCAICATMAMANTALASAPPSLSVPLTVTALRTAFPSEAIATGSRRAAFRSRAPPLS